MSQLIVRQPFALLVTQIARLRDDTYGAGFAYMTEMLRGIAPEMMADSLIGAMDHLELNDEQKEQFFGRLLHWECVYNC